MIYFALPIGFVYGYISVKGQFCMNSGFADVTRQKDTTKLKSFLLAILVQLAVMPLVFTLIFLFGPEDNIINKIQLPPLYLIGTALGGFLFGVFMYFAGGCAAGIFYKLGEKKIDTIFAILGFVGGVYIMESGVLQSFKQVTQSIVLFNQQPVWRFNFSTITLILIVVGISIVAIGLLYALITQPDKRPNGALWGWKRTGLGIGILGIFAWISALFAELSYGMSIIPGVLDMTGLTLSWGLLFVLGIPLGAYWSNRKNSTTSFLLPNPLIISKRLFGGLGLGITASMAAGCTVGHGLTFTSLLGVGSIISLVFIFLGSGLVGLITRK
jgi:uncharacterized membrane protein YedE/YeeE